MTEIVGVAGSAVGGFGLAFVAVFGIAMVAGVAYRWPGRVFNVLMILIALASVAAITLSGRVLRLGDEGLMSEPEGGGLAGTIAKAFLVAAIAVSVGLCAAWFVRLRKNWVELNRFYQRGLCAPNNIVWAFMFFYVAFSFLPIFLGQHYYVHVSLVYPFFIFLALFLWIQVSTVDPVTVMKQCLGMLAFLSLGAALVAPEFAMEPGYVGLFPVYSFRLWGVTASANTLGSIGAVLLVLEAAQPSKKRWLGVVTFIVAGLVLAMTQSKTSIIAAFLGITIIVGWRLFSRLRQYSVSTRTHEQRVVLVVLALGMAAVVVSGALIMFADTSMLASADGKFNARAVGDLKTATGRTLIWKMAIDGGMENPLFGQGADFWSLENRLRTGLTGAVHAHNLYLQVFSRSGFVGVGAFLVFLYFLVMYAIRAATVTGGGSLALLIVFLVRSMSEVPIQPNSILGGEFFASFTLIVFVMDKGAKPFALAGTMVPKRIQSVPI